MKKLLIFGMLIFAGWACTQQRVITQSGAETKSVIIDSTEYQLTIIDPDFDRWYFLRYSPALDRSNVYYRSRNIIAVNNWNDYFMRGRYTRVINSFISYDQSVDYGIEVNRRLYWYFTYMEENFRIRLLR
ncbi:MAG: hypothetical protein K0B15_13120 [Lentimicrobium sp.]|nr:hypothetical protein [Lentimicrobium sp.]